MTLGYDYMLAFDHRASFSKNLLGIAGQPTPAEIALRDGLTQAEAPTRAS